ncbi:MAG: OmpH family outer membrane protein [Pseudomonadota bacterium]|nr:OmpH family outer membrane protein [Pseudomonadota bacterium]
MIKRFVVTSILFLSSALFTQVIAESSIAVIDMKSLVENSTQMQKTKEQLQAKFAPRHDELVNENKALAKKYEDFEREKAVLSQKKVKEVETALQKEQQELVSKEAQFRQELYTAQEEAMKKIVDSVKLASEKVAKKKGFVIVLDAGSTTYVDAKYNITDEVSKIVEV